MGAITPAVMNQSDALASQIKAKMLTDYMNNTIGGALNSSPSQAGGPSSSSNDAPMQASPQQARGPLPYQNISLLGKLPQFQGSGGMLDMFGGGISPTQADPGFMPQLSAGSEDKPSNPLSGLLSMFPNLTLY